MRIPRLPARPWVAVAAVVAAAAILLTVYTAAPPTIAAADDAPTITLSQVGDSEAVLITWTPVSNATGYRIERSKGWLGDDEQYINIADAQATQYTDTAVQYDNVYQYQVKAKKDGTDGAWSEQKHIQMSAPPGTPDTPTNVQSQENTPGDVTITWEHPEGGNDRTGYHLYRYNWSSGDGDIKIATKGASETAHTDTTVSPETLYSYHLRAYNEHGNSLASYTNTISTKVQTPGVPDAPTNLTASEDTQGQVSLGWEAPVTGETVNGYTLYRYRWTSGASDSCKTITIATLDADTTTYTDTSPAAEVFYEYHVRTYNDKGRSSISNVAYLTTKTSQSNSQDDSPTKDANTDPTGLPTISRGTPKVGTALTADTAAIRDSDGLASPGYTYQWIQSTDTNISGATSSSYTPRDADAGQTLKVKVNFTDDNDNNETLTSLPTQAVLPTTPGAPTRLSATTGQREGEITPSWQAPASNGGAPITSYKLQWKQTSGDWNTTGDVSDTTTTGTSHTITDLTAGAAYNVRVAAVNSAGQGTASAEASARAATAPADDTTDDDPAEQTAGEPTNTPPTGRPTISGTPQVEQTLTADTSAINDADGLTSVAYRYQWTSSGVDIDAATASTLTITANHQGKTVQVKVSFTDDAGNEESLTSEATEAVTAKPVPLTASITDAPNTHSGSGFFTFTLSFSENIKAGYKRIRDKAFTVTDGDVAKAKRKVKGSNQNWTITVEPAGNGAVSITLPETTDCDVDGAICTYDKRMLSNSTSVTISGPQ